MFSRLDEIFNEFDNYIDEWANVTNIPNADHSQFNIQIAVNQQQLKKAGATIISRMCDIFSAAANISIVIIYSK